MQPYHDGKKPLFEQLRGLFLLLGFGVCTLAFLIAIDRFDWSAPEPGSLAAMSNSADTPAATPRVS